MRTHFAATAVAIRLVMLASFAAVGCAGLTGCGRDDASRERELASRERALAEKEREQSLADREAKLAERERKAAQSERERANRKPPVEPVKAPEATVAPPPLTFDAAKSSLKTIAAELRKEGIKEYDGKERIFSDEEKDDVKRIIEKPPGSRLLVKEAVILGVRLNLKNLLAARMIESMIADRRAMKIALIVWDRSPKSRSVVFLSEFLERYWKGDEGYLGMMDVVAQRSVYDAVERYERGGANAVNAVSPEELPLIVGSSHLCARFFEGFRGPASSLPRDERSALIRFAGEEAVLNSP